MVLEREIKTRNSFLRLTHPFCEAIKDIGTLVSVLNILPKLKIETFFQRCSAKKMFLEISQNSQESTCARVSFLIKLKAQACNFIEKETLTQVFSCEFCGISKSTFSCRTSSVAASVINNFKTSFSICFEISYALKKRPHPAQVLPVNF